MGRVPWSRQSDTWRDTLSSEGLSITRPGSRVPQRCSRVKGTKVGSQRCTVQGWKGHPLAGLCSGGRMQDPGFSGKGDSASG